jgi:hypothetical protein
MNPAVIIALCLWPVVSLWLVSALGAQRGLVAAVVGGSLLLPFVGIQIVEGLPGLSRDGAIALSAIAAILIFAPASFVRYRFHWVDAMVLGGLLAWGLTNLANGIGIQQALLDWWWFAMYAAIPYFLGRCVLDRPPALVALAVGIVGGTLLMVPFVLFELRMSPSLHYWVYGHAGNTVDMYRYGGWRPKVFQWTGLALAIWLGASAVVAWALWYSKTVASVWRIPIALVAASCLVMGFFGRGGGAISLMVVGLAVLTLAHLARRPRLTFVLPAMVIFYLVTAFTDFAVPVRPFLLSTGEAFWGQGAGGSLRVRIDNEAFLVAKAMQKPLLGFGGWGDFRLDYELASEMGLGRVLTDSLWTIALGQRGLWGVLCLYGMYLIPGIIAVHAAARAGLGRHAMALVMGLSLFCWVYAADLLFNAFATPVLALTAGALTSFAMFAKSMRSRRRPVGDQGTFVGRGRVLTERPQPVGTHHRRRLDTLAASTPTSDVERCRR